MYAFQENKKQIEELNSSQIKEILVSYTQRRALLQNLHLKEILTAFQLHVSLDHLYDEISEVLSAACSVTYDIESLELDDPLIFDQCEIDFMVQSDAIDLAPVELSTSSTEQNVSFTDAPNDVIAAIPHPMSHVKIDSSQNVDLGKYLERPVQIYTKTWAIGDTIDSNLFNPWHAFFNKAAIKRKLDNYYMVRCNLHLKFVINASPFYYGCVLSSYQPLTNFNPAPVAISTSGRKENISYSQRPHIYLYPANSQGGEMVLPFLSQKNWLNATSAADLLAMGAITLNSFSTLKNANGVAVDDIDIVVYAWAEDLEVAGPTIDLAVQSDEYMSEGAVSKPASAIARAASLLGSVPIIGPFATATSYAAGAIADIATLFGYTNVPVIEDVNAFYTKPFPNMASTDIGTPIEKLTLDAKNELSIDAKIAGVEVNDELVMKDFLARESYIFTSSWASSDPIDTSLFFTKVAPNMMDVESVANQTIVWGTPMNHVAQCFDYWRGDIIYRFKIICTKYHRGRIRVCWDPHGAIGVSGDYTTEVYTKIVDITEETDVEFRVPYTQPTAYLQQSKFIGDQMAQSGTSTAGVGSVYNGTLSVRVLNKLTSPVTTADIKILAFVRGSDNLEFASPSTLGSTMSPYVVQSQSYDLELDTHDMGGVPSSVDPSINLVYMGETCVSLRQLMRRQSAYTRISTTASATGDGIVESRSILPRSPMYPGFDPAGFHSATGLNSAATEPYNFVNWTYVTWFSQCFVGSRGSYIYSLNASHINPLDSVSVSRSQFTRSPANLMSTTSYANTAGFGRQAFMRGFTLTDEYDVGMSGFSLTNQKTQSGVTALVPMYSRFKFISNSAIIRNDGSSVEDTDVDSMNISSTNIAVGLQPPELLYHDVYTSIGTDFNLIFFLNVPVIYIYSSLPYLA